MKFTGLVVLLLFTTVSAFAGKLDEKYPGDAGVYLVKGEKQQTAIARMLETVDVPFEMGDGYYGFESMKLYIVRDQAEVLGFMEEYKLSYTEDPEYVFVLVRYDRNGQLVGEIEELRREPVE